MAGERGMSVRAVRLHEGVKEIHFDIQHTIMDQEGKPEAYRTESRQVPWEVFMDSDGASNAAKILFARALEFARQPAKKQG